MPTKLRRKWIIISTIVLASLFGIIELPGSIGELRENWNKNIRLGLDLMGGSHIVLQIQVQDAFKAEADHAIVRLREELQNADITYASIERNEPSSVETADSIQITVRGIPEARTVDFQHLVNAILGEQWTIASDSEITYRLIIRPETALKLRRDTMLQSINTLERKIDALGVAETSIQQRGGDARTEILVQLPGIDDPVRVKGILQTAAILELSEVLDGPFASQDAVFGRYGGVLPPNSKIVRESSARGGAATWWVIGRSPVVTGRDLRDARPERSDVPGRWDTGFVLTYDAARRFERFTEANIGRHLAIVIDNVVLSVPQIQDRISDRGRIVGAGTQQEAADLALNLRAGSLPASVRVIEERTVGPSLGADSIRQGLTAGLVGLLLVIASMVLYYRGAGLNAVIALILNTLITIAALSYLDATWTLPGIAGLVLSIGMAVDSNVLIFERIKEEMRSGKTVTAAINAGFDRALVTIIDTHVTTVVASAFLFLFGTGPVRGFAVTLVIGLIANLFTAVFVSRSIFEVQTWRKPRRTHLSIGVGRTELLGGANINFLRQHKMTVGLSLLMILLSTTSIFAYGLKPGIDFRGGTLVHVKFAVAPEIEDLRRVLSSKLPGEITVQQTMGSGEFIIGTELADEDTLEQARLTVEETLRETYGNPEGKLDLNNATQSALSDRLRTALPPTGITFSEDELESLAARILSYRDRERSGLIQNLNDLSAVQGVDDGILSAIKDECAVGQFNIRSVEIVGPRAGEQLRQQALLATVGALGGMLIYIAFRFQLISGFAAVIAIVHDVILTLGIFALTDREITLNIIAALLTLIGYSMNDKIVVFDRVRENQRLGSRARSFLELVNHSIHQTLSRTMLTAGPTLLACIALYYWGGEVLNGIAFVLFVGIMIGTYSSIFVASALLVLWNQHRGGVRQASARVP